MRSNPIYFLIMALMCIGVMGRAQTTPKQILFDFRIDRKFSVPKIPMRTQRSVLSKVFRKYLTDENQCNPNFDASGNSDPLRAARNAGQMVPSIVDTATGSFTAAGAAQTLYVISVSECNASHADNFGTKRVAIFSDEQLIAEMDDDFNSSIIRKTDLNGDGLDELLMTGGDMNQGTAVESAALLEFRGGRMRVIEDFGTVSENSCASGLPSSGIRASVISIGSAGPGDMPKLTMQNYRAGCRNPKRWRFISTGKMPD